MTRTPMESNFFQKKGPVVGALSCLEGFLTCLGPHHKVCEKTRFLLVGDDISRKPATMEMIPAIEVLKKFI